MKSPESNVQYQGSVLLSSLRCPRVLQGALAAEGAPAPCSSSLVRWDCCANIISCDVVICFLLPTCFLCCCMNWWRGKVELQLCSLGIICFFWSTTLQQSALCICGSAGSCFVPPHVLIQWHAGRHCLLKQSVVLCFFYLSFSWGFLFAHSVHFFTSNTTNWHLCCAVLFLLKTAVHNKSQITSSFHLTIVIKNFSFFPSVCMLIFIWCINFFYQSLPSKHVSIRFCKFIQNMLNCCWEEIRIQKRMTSSMIAAENSQLLVTNFSAIFLYIHSPR